MEEFIKYISQFGNLNQHQIDLILSKAEILKLKKNEYFWEAEKSSKHVGFITDGILRVCICNNNGEETTRYFITENHLILGNERFNKNNPSLQAITDCKLIIFSNKNWKELLNEIIGLDNIIQKIITNHNTEKLERRSSLVSQDATTRYLEFIRNFPALINRIPLSYIASYLGITQSSLSRIRKNIS